MPLSLETLRVRIGLQDTDSTRDAEISSALKTALAFCETYCDRKLILQHDKETFTHVSGGTVSLHRYPVSRIVSMDAVNGNSRSYHLEAMTGLVHFDGHVHDHELTVQYDGGYFVTGMHDPVEFPGELVEMPEDLLFAILQVFDKVWAAQSGGGAAVATGGVRSFRVGDISLGFDTGAAASSAASQGAFGGMVDPAAAAILSLYMGQKA